MASFNKVILMGNLTADPELRQTPSGVSVCRFTIAVQRLYGEKKTDFFEVVAWRVTAEFVSRYFCKGQAILVCGNLQNNEWTDKNGSKRIRTEVIADDVTFADSRQRNEAPEPVTPTFGAVYAAANADQVQQNTFEVVEEDSDLPF